MTMIIGLRDFELLTVSRAKLINLSKTIRYQRKNKILWYSNSNDIAGIQWINTLINVWDFDQTTEHKIQLPVADVLSRHQNSFWWRDHTFENILKYKIMENSLALT